ncbi:hypothetical protein ACFPN2_15560 [Steroidobacter flavus]|uniref:Uncharacterized protein n=1 Tax=Steroidobacter flavus TaxID=1842136 RepID=A0ABV8SV62_9GAMM
MRFVDPCPVVCPGCGKESRYPPRELVALSSICHHCSTSLESVGREMRAGLSSWSAHLAKMNMAVELERVFGIEASDADLEQIKVPVDFVRFIRNRAGVAASSKDVDSEVLAALTRTRQTTANISDLKVAFEALFPVAEHP